MAENFEAMEESWWERAAHALSGLLRDSYQKDWMGDANCLVDTVDDKQFLYKPDRETEKRWEFICRTCPVALQCMEWADENKPSEVFIAGEWREGEG